MDHKFAQTFLKLGRNYLGDTNSLLLSQKSYGRDFFPFVSTPFLLDSEKQKGVLFGPLNELKIAEQEACG